MDNDGYTVEVETSFSSDPARPGTTDSDDYRKPTEYETVDINADTKDTFSPDMNVMLSSTEKPSLPVDRPYADMGKEDLLRFSDTSFWQRFRLISILLFWAAWLGLLGAVIGLTVVAPRCDKQPEPMWWQESVVYQIYVRSFFDTDGDGVGDIQGVIDKLSYLKSLHVNTVLLSSVFESEHERFSDYGYEITNHTNIQSLYGSADVLHHLINAAHNESMHVLIDFIPNHTGKNHFWFQESRATSNYTNEFWNYFVWANCDPTTPPSDYPSTPPNNWWSVYNESAWSFDISRKQCYLHQFLSSQPELNLRSSGVQGQLERILRFWLDFGVDGFRVINTAYLFESSDLQDEAPTSQKCLLGSNNYNCYDHSNTLSLPENYDMVARWREIIDEYNSGYTNFTRVLITDADLEATRAVRYYGNKYGLNGAHLAINYGMTRFNSGLSLNNIVRDWIDGSPMHATPNWLTGDQDRSRLSSNMDDSRLINAFHMLRMTLPGVAFLYYGEEIGMENLENLEDGNRHDPAGNISLTFSRDRYRTPMQWTNNTDHGGFMNVSNGNPWLPISNASINVENQQGHPDSTLEFIRSMNKLRQDEGSLRYGAIHYLLNDTNVFSYIREHEGNNRILVIVNIGNSTTSNINLHNLQSSISLPTEAEVIIVTNTAMNWSAKEKINLRSIELNPGDGIIAKWEFVRSL